MSEQWTVMWCGFKADPVLMVRGNGNAVAVVHKGDGLPKTKERQWAEANLLAAAPDLLDAVETLLLAVKVDKVEGIGHATDKAEAALAKAKVGGFVPEPVGLLEAAKEILRRHEDIEARMSELIDRDGEKFAAGYLEGIGQAADLLAGHVAESEGYSGQAA